MTSDAETMVERIGDPMTTLTTRIEAANGLHDKLARSHTSLTRGMVWCTTCGISQSVSSAYALKHGWPKHCGYTMTIDSPEERRILSETPHAE